jgi:hypothetical protein
VSRVNNRTMHAINKRRRTRKSAIDVAEQVVAPKQRKNLRTPENIVIRR